MRTLSFPARANPLNVARPVVVAVSPLLREVIIAVTDTSAATSPAMSAPARRRLEEVALDQLRVIDTLPLWLPEPTDSRLRHLADILRADPADGRTLTELGVVVGAGARTLSRLFNQQTGMSFPQWRAQLRLHHSLLLLAEGHPVTATALACGYENPSAFIESFRHSFGITPGAHQRQTLRAADIPEARLRD
jgi:AraC-like DNA-binding protein